MAQSADVQKAVAALQCNLALDEETRKMLSAGLPFASEVAPAERHRYQTDVIRMAEEAMKTERRGCSEEEAAATKKIEVEQAALEQLQTHAKEARRAEERGVDQLSQKETSRNEMDLKISGAEPLAEIAKTTEEEAATKFAARRKVRDDAANIVDSVLKKLVDGAFEDDGGDAAIESVLLLLMDCNAEDPLIAAVPAALQTKPAMRKDFDRMVSQSVHDLVAKHVAALASEVATLEKEQDEAEAESLGLWAMLDFSRDALQEMDKELGFARAGVKVAKELRAKADQDVARQQRVVKQIISTKTEQVPVAKAVDDALNAIERLRIGNYEVEAAAPMEVEVEAAAQDVEMAAAAGTVV